jgi:hypothetical protein
MKATLLAIVYVGILVSSYSQPVQFDIATVVPPAGWVKEDKGSLLSFTKTNNLDQSYGVMALYKSTPSSGDATADFESDWNELVSKQFQLIDNPLGNTPQPKKGWEVFSRSSAFMQDGKKAIATLITFSNGKKVMSVLCLLNSPAYSDDFKRFYNALELNASEVAPKPLVIAAASFGDYIFTPPPGWSSEKANDAIILRGPDRSSIITILPMVTSSGDLEKDMDYLFWQAFAGWQADEQNPDHHIFTKGIAPAGWEYYKKEIGIRAVNNPQTEIYGFVFLAKLNGAVAVIGGCYNHSTDLLDEQSKTDWIQFFHSLDFKNYKSTGASALAKDIIGNWLIGSSSGVSTYEFASNGHYANANAFSTSHQVSDYAVKETTTSFVGDGTYSIKGNELTLTSNKGIIQKPKIRIFYQKEYGDWLKTIGMLSNSTVDGTSYEAIYRWQEKK